MVYYIIDCWIYQSLFLSAPFSSGKEKQNKKLGKPNFLHRNNRTITAGSNHEDDDIADKEDCTDTQCHSQHES